MPDGKGASDFDALEVAMGPRGRSADMLFYLFDILHLDGFDLRAAPLVDRKRILKELISGVGAPILFSDHMEDNGQKIFAHACEMGLEGVIAKRMDAPYRSGRTESWIKVKCVKRETFTIVGYTPEGNGLVAALHLARKEGRELAYVGKVGTGWSMKQSGELRKRLKAIEVDRPLVPVPGRFPKSVFGANLEAVAAKLTQQFPVGIDVVRVADQSGVVKEAIGSFVTALLQAVLIVLAVSFLTLGLRAGLVVARSAKRFPPQLRAPFFNHSSDARGAGAPQTWTELD